MSLGQVICPGGGIGQYIWNSIVPAELRTNLYSLYI